MTRFPYKIGYDASGVVAEVGSGVAEFKVGDEVYVRLPEIGRGELSPIPSSLRLRQLQGMLGRLTLRFRCI